MKKKIMLMAFQNLDTSVLDVYNPILGSALNFPKGYWEPGSLSAYKGHFGGGSTLIPFSGSLVCAPGPTSPISFNSTGIDVHTGVWNTFGTDIKSGTDVSIGALNVSYSAVFSELNGLKSSVTPDWGVTAPIIKSNGVSIFENSPNGNLNGFWKYNGLFISTGPHTSDIRLKKNIKPLTNGLDKIMKLNPVTFNWDEKIVPDLARKYPHMVGLIAQEVEEVVPEVVYKTRVNSVKDGKEKGRIYKRVLYENLVAHLIDGMKEQQKQIEELKQRVSELEN
jgi:polyhydroxyalkanoate synthesis regulator phasin